VELFETGFSSLYWGNLVMWLIAFGFIYLGIARKMEPLLLVPIGFGMLLVNLPLGGLFEYVEGMPEGLLAKIFTYLIAGEIIPPLIFLSLGAMTDFGPLIANPKTLLLGAAAQFGVYFVLFIALLFGFDIKEACSIGIIGGADGPTSIYLSAKLAPHLLGPIAVAAYSYMALVPIIQPPVIKALTTKKRASDLYVATVKRGINIREDFISGNRSHGHHFACSQISSSHRHVYVW